MATTPILLYRSPHLFINLNCRKTRFLEQVIIEVVFQDTQKQSIKRRTLSSTHSAQRSRHSSYPLRLFDTPRTSHSSPCAFGTLEITQCVDVELPHTSVILHSKVGTALSRRMRTKRRLRHFKCLSSPWRTAPAWKTHAAHG